jgi:dihydrolipoamide dehydrogenase
MPEARFDLIIIGAGPAGHIAAERAGALGKKVLVAEKAHLGGVCTNQGCIPTKTLLYSAKLYAQARHSEAFGVSVEGARYDIAKAMAWKTKTIETIRKGIAYQFRTHGVELATGSARIVGRAGGLTTVEVDGKQYSAPNVMIATGSAPVVLPIPGAERAMGSTEALEISTLPKSIVVIGGGYIGMEFASYFTQVGAKVSVVEMLPEVVPLLDPAIARVLRGSLPDADFHLGAKVLAIEPDPANKAGHVVRFSKDGKEQSIAAEAVLMSVGRKPIVDGIGLESVGVEFDRKGIRVDDRMRTNVPGIWAAGDVNARSMLAHSASRMAEVAVADMFAGDAAQAGNAPSAQVMRYNAIPWVVYTYPEVAGAGMSEEQAKAAGRTVTTAMLDHRANGRFVAESDRTRGMTKVVVDAATGVLLGVQMIGPYSSEMIAGVAAMIEAELRVKDIREIVFPHPTVSEAIRDTIWSLKE